MDEKEKARRKYNWSMDAVTGYLETKSEFDYTQQNRTGIATYQQIKQTRQKRRLDLTIFIIILLILGIILTLIAFKLEASNLQVFVMNLATEVFGGVLLFVILEVVWARFNNSYQQHEKELEEKLDRLMVGYEDRLAKYIEEMKRHNEN